MSNLLPTLAIAVVVILVALLILGIGWLLTGKNRLRGSCGMTPNKDKADPCGKDISCPMCSPEEEKKKNRR